jgi:hypothetical protein
VARNHRSKRENINEKSVRCFCTDFHYASGAGELKKMQDKWFSGGE